MAVDMIARMMAMGNSGGSGDSYTKAETDALLADKADKSTTYTKTEVDAALAEKLNTADVDADISSTSTNPVQNKVIQAPLARLVDAGAKNFLEVTATSKTINGVSFTVNENKTITVDGTATDNIVFFVNTDIPASMLRSGKFTGCPANGSGNTYLMILEQNSTPFSGIAYDYGSGCDLSYTGNINADCYIQIKSGVTVNNLVFKPMICTTEDYAISQEFVPYSLDNLTLTKRTDILPSLVNRGAKNELELIKPYGSGITNNPNLAVTLNSDQTITVNGSVTTSGTIRISNIISGKLGKYLSGRPAGVTADIRLTAYTQPDWSAAGNDYKGEGATITDDGNIVIAIYVVAGQTYNNVTLKPMICTAEDYKISPEFIPYAKSNYELTRDVRSIPSLVDSGAKNLFNQSESYAFDNVSNDNGVYTTAGDTLTTLRFKIVKYLNGSRVEDLVSQFITSNGVYYWEFTKYSTFDSFMIGHNGSTYNGRFKYDLGKLENGRNYVIRIDITRCSDSNGSFQWRDIMICTSEYWAISHEFVPYAPTNQVLYKETVPFPTNITEESQLDGLSQGTITTSLGASIAGYAAGTWVVIRTYDLNAAKSRKMQIIETQTGGRKTRFYNGAWGSWT